MTEQHATDPNRLKNGQFAPGNTLTRGRPDRLEVRLVREFRQRLLKSITAEQAEIVMRALLVSAVEDRSVSAAKELLNRLVGPPVALDVFDRVAQLEDEIAGIKEMLAGQGGSYESVGIQDEVSRLLATNEKGDSDDEDANG